MNKQHSTVDQETVLKALDQLSQTIEAMALVIKRLKNSVENNNNPPSNAEEPALQNDFYNLPSDKKILH